MRRAALTFGLIAVGALGFGQASSAIELKLIGVRSIPARTMAHGAMVGGLSGLDYDAAADRWLAISDDKAEHGPARFLEARLDYDAKEFTAVEITGVTKLLEPDGSDYPDRPHFLASHRGEVPDFESLRLDPRDYSIWYTSEGDRGLGLQPFVRHAARGGKFLGELPRPAMFSFLPSGETGPRHNLVFEGLTFAPDGESLWVAMEGPLYQDGPAPTATSGALTRFTRLARDGKILRQFAYPVEKLPVAPPPGKLADNGVSEILSLDADRLLVLERAGWQDEAATWHFTAKIYFVDVGSPTDISAVRALAGARVIPVSKRLGFDFSTAGPVRVDNLEGLAWGRRLANGHATLVVASDDNFSVTQETQFWVFDVLPETPNPSSSPP